MTHMEPEAQSKLIGMLVGGSLTRGLEVKLETSLALLGKQGFLWKVQR